MIKIMHRSIWYYIKRPNFAFCLLFSTPSVRTYSLFVMDLIEADMIEFDLVGSSYKNDWKIKGTISCVDKSLTNLYIDDILRQQYRKMLDEKQKSKVEEKIATHLEALKGKDIQNG